MAKLKVVNMSGENVKEIDVLDTVFNTEVNEHLLYEAVKNYRANQRQGTHSAKTRAEVRGGGRKPFRQKGTGRARQGTIRAPHHVGGGVVFAKKPRDYSYKLPKKIKRAAMRSALSSKFKLEEIIVLDNLNLDTPKTKDLVKVLDNLNANQKSMIVTLEKNENVYLSGRNIPKVNISNTGEINVYDILNCDSFLITEEAINKLQEVYA